MGRRVTRNLEVRRDDLDERWGAEVAAEMRRQAEIAAFQAEHPHQRVYPGTRKEDAPELWIQNPSPLSAEEARSARNHLRNALAIVRGRILPFQERPLRQLVEGLRYYRPPVGPRRKLRALFARRVLEWVQTSLPRQPGMAKPLRQFDWRDLLDLARAANVETKKVDAEVDREWRRLWKNHRSDSPTRR